MNKYYDEAVKQEVKDQIEVLLAEYRENGSFSSVNVRKLDRLSEYTPDDVWQQINKFSYIVHQIADNGGIPVLKQLYTMI